MSSQYTKNIQPVMYDLNVFFEKGFYGLYSDYGEFLEDGIDTLDYFIDYNKSNVLFDPIESKVNTFKELDEKGIKNYSELQFKVWWYETFISSMKQVRERFELELGDNVKFFKEISDSIGLLRNVEVLPDDNILPIYDTDLNIASGNGTFAKEQLYPRNVASSVINKLRPETNLMISQMSIFNTSVYRHNMFPILGNISDSQDAHGSNLVSDYFHYARLYNVARGELESDLSKYFLDVYDLVLWYENYNPQSLEDNNQFIEKTNYELTVEGVERKVDFLKQEALIFENTKSLVNLLGVASE